MFTMNRLNTATRTLILRCLVEGMGVNATARTAGVSKNTVLKLLVDAAAVVSGYMDRELRDLPCRRVQIDEAWAFIYAKDANVETAKAPPPEAGDVWTWVAICDDTKIIPTWRVGDRSTETAIDLFRDLAQRVPRRLQITTDGYGSYIEATEQVFAGEVDHAMLVKEYGNPADGDRTAAAKYSPGRVNGTHVIHVAGRPDPKHINTSYVERHNLTMRMSMRRYTRLTNAFSKKLLNHTATVALYMFWYNFIKPHRTLTKKANGTPTTPAMAAGIADWRMKFEDIVAMVDADYEARRPKTRGPYKKRNSN